MRAIRFVAGAALASILVLPAAPDAVAQAVSRVQPELDRDALLRCMADERESRALLERYRQEHEAFSASGHALDAQRRDLEALREATDPRDPAAVERYNLRASEFGTRVERHNAGLAALEASRQAQHAAAQRYNEHCGGRHFQPNTLRSAPEPK
ncbi:MAG: hypothetical protein OZ935_17215 [Pseudomonadota bacterium]|jgi:hypothetical protein|nr:hypothetical protein [Pseudomonadota bacterium]